MKPSPLSKRITREQLTRLIDDAMSYVEQYRTEMEAQFWPKRREYERQSNDDFSSRRNSADPSIFDISNESPNIVRTVTRFMRATCCEDIFGSKPYIGVTPAGALDGPLADQMNRHAPWKIDQAEYGKYGKEAIGLALDLGEAVLKTTHRHDVDQYDTDEIVLVDRKTGKPVLVPMINETGEAQRDDEGKEVGDYIYPEDPTTVDASGRTVFEKAPEIVFDEAVEFREIQVEEKTTMYHGLDVAVLRFDTFIAPLNIPSLDRAPALAQEMTRSVSWLRRMYGSEDADTEALFDLLENDREGTKTAEDAPRATYGMVSAGNRAKNHKNPNVRVLEIYLHDYDVFEDGVGRNIFLVMCPDLDMHEPLYVNYLANITPRGRLPFHPIVVNRVPGYWWGRGFYELYERSQELMDSLINAILYRNENNANPEEFWQPNAVEEGAGDARLIKTPGKVHTLRPGMTAKDARQILEVPDLDDRTWMLVELIMQLIQSDSGVSAAQQGDAGALANITTATGVSSVLQSGATLHRYLTQDLKDGFTPAVVFGLMVIYANQDRDETFRYLEGDAAEVLSLSSARVLATIELNVQILLTRFQMREQREQAQLVITQILPTWVQMLQTSGLQTFNLAADTQQLFVQVAKGADIQHAEKIFALPAPLPPPPPVEPPTGGPIAGGGDTPKDGPAAAAALPTNVIPDGPAESEAAPKPS